ncbi:hypothetical protein SAMN04487913_10835 [Arthrobacter sp. ok362]|nr:hypothetical protein SAMN04487913_10835 [Arthrobacter sp. ok362]
MKEPEIADAGRPAALPWAGAELGSEPRLTASGPGTLPGPASGAESAAGSRTRRRNQTRIASAATAGMTSTANAAGSEPLATSTAETSNGPRSAPAKSKDLWTAKPRPRPTGVAAAASSTVFAGLRTALPTLSPMMSTAARASPAVPARGVNASSGTHTAVSAYPAIVNVQYLPVRSAQGPNTSRSPWDAASAAPVTRPTNSADAPSWASRGPPSGRAPSDTMSVARLTRPKPTTGPHSRRRRLSRWPPDRDGGISCWRAGSLRPGRSIP